MIKHFAADGTVKQEWAEGLHASARFERNGKQFVEVAKSNAIETVEVADGEQVGETFVHAVASALAAAGAQPFEPAADVHPIEAALSASALPPVAIAPDPVPAPETVSAVVETHSAVIPPAIPGSVTEHHVPLPSEVMETAAHALSDAAEVLKQEEEKQTIASASAPAVETPAATQAEHSTEAAQIPTSEATNG